MIAAASALTTIAAIGWKVLDRFRFGDSFAISPHGIGIAVGFLAGAYVLVFEGRKRGVAEETSSALVFWALVGTIIGARGFYVLGHYSEFKGDVAEMLAVYKGGLTLIGGIAGAVIVAYPAMRRRKVGFLRIMDAAAIGLPLGIVIGRIGDLIIGDHIGKPTSWALAFQYHGGNLAGFDCSFAGRCIDPSLYGGHIEIITDRAVRLPAGHGPDAVRAVAESPGTPHGRPVHDVPDRVRDVPHPRGPAADRQAVLRLHRQPVDQPGSGGGRGGGAGVVGAAPVAEGFLRPRGAASKR